MLISIAIMFSYVVSSAQEIMLLFSGLGKDYSIEKIH